MPLGWEMACAISAVLASWGLIAEAVFVWARFDTYGGPTESMRTMTGDVVPPIANTRTWRPAVRLNPRTRAASSKVGALDEVLIFSDGHRKVAGDAFFRLF